MLRPMVTVLLPVYNRPTVVNTIQSVLEQTYADFELLVIDNASTDNTRDEIKKMKDERIRLIVNETNMGQTYSLNRGLELAEGAYIARIDADDLMVPERLEKQVAFMEKNPNYGLCGSWVQYITDDDKKSIVVKLCSSDNTLRVAQRVSCGAYHPAVLIRNSVIRNNKIKYNEKLKMAEDYDMWNKILKFSKGVNLPEVLTYYRRGSNNDSVNNLDLTRKEGLYIRRKICKEDGDFPGRSEMSRILHIEKKEKISLISFICCYFFYDIYLKKNVLKMDKNYIIIKQRIISTMLGTCIRDNRALWARIVYFLYTKLRRKVYKLIKE